MQFCRVWCSGLAVQLRVDVLVWVVLMFVWASCRLRRRVLVWARVSGVGAVVGLSDWVLFVRFAFFDLFFFFGFFVLACQLSGCQLFSFLSFQFLVFSF